MLRYLDGIFMLPYLIGFCLHTHAAEFKVADEELHVNGFLDVKDRAAFIAALSGAPQVKAVVFEKSLGGHYGAYVAMADAIGRRKLNTVVSAQCSSACAYLFLTGEQRSFKSGFRPIVMSFHVSRSAADSMGQGPLTDADRSLLALLSNTTHGKLDGTIMSAIQNSKREDQGVVFVSYQLPLLPTLTTALHCDGSQGKDLGKCKKLGSINLKDVGILTR